MRLKGIRGLNQAFFRSPHLLTDQIMANVPAQHSLGIDRRNTDLDSKYPQIHIPVKIKDANVSRLDLSNRPLTNKGYSDIVQNQFKFDLLYKHSFPLHVVLRCMVGRVYRPCWEMEDWFQKSGCCVKHKWKQSAALSKSFLTEQIVFKDQRGTFILNLMPATHKTVLMYYISFFLFASLWKHLETEAVIKTWPCSSVQ